tara:strand:+ start:35 stop:181 length:147 start_codon:yes stop_codon:yes gene_type:complete
MAKLNSVNGILNKNLPPIANNSAKIIDPIKINFLKYLDEELINGFNKK